jgi:hypothetical protein
MKLMKLIENYENYETYETYALNRTSYHREIYPVFRNLDRTEQRINVYIILIVTF